MAIKKFENPLLLLDNSNMNTLFNEGEFKCTNMTFEEVREIISMYDKEDIVLCFTQPDTYDIIFNYIGIPKKDYAGEPGRYYLQDLYDAVGNAANHSCRRN